MGVKASLTSELSLEDVPATCMLGPKGAGISALREILVEIRLMTAALALGVGRAALEEALAYSMERQQFGRPIAKYQAIQSHLAKMRTGLEAARRFVSNTHRFGGSVSDSAAEILGEIERNLTH